MTLPSRIQEYTIVKELGQGGMAEVLLGQSLESPPKQVAIKRLYPHMARRAENVKMFLHEAKLMSQLHHPNIIEILDFGHEGETYFIVMEYADGITLKQVFDRARVGNLQIPLSMGIYIVMEVLKGLDYLHHATTSDGSALNIIHRDLSPDNVLISRNGRVRLSDFGIARSKYQEHQSQTGVIKGKLNYQSPEQLMEKRYDQRSDLFCMGALLYEATTMHKAFSCKDFASAVVMICQQPTIYPTTYAPNYPEALEKITLRSLAKEPAQRFQSAEEMRRSLESYLQSTDEAFDQESLASVLKRLETFADLVPLDQSISADFPVNWSLQAASAQHEQETTLTMLKWAIAMLAFSFSSGIGLVIWFLFAT